MKARFTESSTGFGSGYGAENPVLIVALAAVLLAGALYSHHLTSLVNAGSSADLACSATGVFDCAKNLESAYGKVFGIPVSAFATALFVFLLVNTLLNLIRLRGRENSFALPLLLGCVAGLISVYYLSVSIFVLHSICLYCTVLYALIALTIGISYFGFCGDTKQFAAAVGLLQSRIPSLSLSLALAGAAVWLSAGGTSQNSPELAPPLHSGSKTISITEFGDFECAACKNAGLELEKLKLAYPGKLKVEFVNYPLCHDCNPDVPRNLHEHACMAARLGIAMKNRGKFEEYCHKVFSVPAQLDESRLYRIVSELGEGEVETRQIADSAQTAEELWRDIEWARRIGVQATPTLIIDGKVIQGGGAIVQLKTALANGIQFADAQFPASTPLLDNGAAVTVRSLSAASSIQVPGPSADLFNNPYYSCVRNFYVSTTGNDSNDGSAAHPWLTLQNADSAAGGRIAGDCINVAPGTYPGGVTPAHGGNLASSTGYVVWRCQTLDGCKITANGDPWNPSFRINAAGSGPNYLTIDGFELASSNYGVYAAGVIVVDPNNPGSGSTKTMHHLWVTNCIIHGFGEAGIGVNGTDFQYYIHNTVYGNSHATCDAQGSGIGIVVPKSFGVTPSADDKTNPNPRIGTFVNGSDFFHNVIEWNVVYNNALTQCGTVNNPYDTDGNNIIMDTFNTWNGNSATYPHQTLVALNAVYNSGGGGVHIFSSNYVTVANNTCYNNYLDPANNGSARGCIDSTQSFGDTYINNIAVAVVPAYTSCSYGTSPYAMWNSAILGSPLSGNPADTFSHNITYMIGSKPGCNGEVAIFGQDAYSSTLNKMNTNPMWTNVGTTSVGTETTPPVGADFTLKPGSPAIGYALPESYLPGITDAGAYQTGGVKPPTANLSANPTSIALGASSTLTWSSTNATSCTGTGFSTGNAVSGSVSVQPTANMTYSVSCANGSTSVSASVTVAVVSPPPLITSASAARGTVGNAFDYHITATNSPSSYGATGLPAWASINTSTGVITGVPTAVGSSTITISAKNAAGIGTAMLNITIANAPPKITSGPTATPNPVLSGQSVAFAATASDADGDTLTYSWTFGDGATGSGANPSHAYGAAGIFTATVSVSDGHNPDITGSVTVSVSKYTATAINSGGSGVGSFVADANFSGGNKYATSHAVSTTGIVNPAPQAVYQSERFGNFTYTISGLTDGETYKVRLHFAEIWWNAAGKRVFNVSINGQQKLTNFDIFAATGGEFIAIVKEFTASSSGGVITIKYSTVKDNAKSSGIEVISTSAAARSVTVQAAGLAPASDDGVIDSIDLGTVKYGQRLKIKLDAPDSGEKVKLRWNVVDRSKLPPGMTVSRSGILTGKPKTQGNFTFQLRIVEASNRVTNSYKLAVTP